MKKVEKILTKKNITRYYIVILPVSMQVWCCTKINDRKQPQLREVHPRVVCNFIRLEISFKKKLDQTERKNACQAHAISVPA